MIQMALSFSERVLTHQMLVQTGEEGKDTEKE